MSAWPLWQKVLLVVGLIASHTGIYWSGRRDEKTDHRAKAQCKAEGHKWSCVRCVRCDALGNRNIQGEVEFREE